MNLEPIKISRKTGQEKFYSDSGDLNIQLLDFWQWATSDLLSNATRGILAEFIVATDLGVSGEARNEWGAYDLETLDGIKIEVKTSGYLQSWYQEKLSTIGFDIKPTTFWNPATNKFEGERKRHSDFYIFCLLDHKDKRTVDPMKLDQWIFFILATEVLDKHLPKQKRLSLKQLLELEPVKCKYREIRNNLRNELKTNNA